MDTNWVLKKKLLTRRRLLRSLTTTAIGGPLLINGTLSWPGRAVAATPSVGGTLRLAMGDASPKSLTALNRLILSSPPMVRGGTHAVLGEGPLNPDIALVGEQPGDQEDLQGRPFVGPAGKLLDRALEHVGIVRAQTYVTNAVKHFKFEQRGKRRIHSKPNSSEIKVCSSHWLARELDAINPDLIVALGATAAQALMGKAIPIGKNRGHELEWSGGHRGLITVHPSYLLRLPDEESKAREYKAFVHDLKMAARLLERKAA